MCLKTSSMYLALDLLHACFYHFFFIFEITFVLNLPVMVQALTPKLEQRTNQNSKIRHIKLLHALSVFGLCTATDYY